MGRVLLAILSTVFLLHAVNGQTEQPITDPIKAELGGVVVIPCNLILAENETLFTVLWKHNEDDIATVGATGEVYPHGQYGERSIVDGTTYELTLEALLLDDSGTYVCSGFGNKGSKSQTYQVDVLSSPQVNTRVNPYLDDGLGSGTATLAVCTATGASEPFTMNWLTDMGDVVVPDSFRADTANEQYYSLIDSTLYLDIRPNAERDNGRKFTCSVQDAFGKTIESEAVLVVTAPTTTAETTTMQASPAITSFPTNNGDEIIMLLGEQRTFECTATGVPTPAVTWYKGDSKVPFPWGTPGKAIITIDAARYEDSDSYICKAENQEGQIENILQLVVQGQPVIPSSGTIGNETEKIEIVNEEVVTLTCKASANPYPDIVWTVEGVNKSDLSINEAVETTDSLVSSTVNISAKHFESEPKIVTCFAANELGKASKDFVVSKQIPAAANTGVIVGVVIAVLILVALLLTGAFFILSRRSQKSEVTASESAENGCCGSGCFTNPCAQPVEPVVEEEEDQVKEVKEDGTSEEKQKLTEAEEKPAAKEAEKEGDEKNPEEEKPEESEEPKEKKSGKKMKLSFAPQCCKGNKEELKEEASIEEEAAEEENKESNGHTPQTENETGKQRETDQDSGKGDTLEKAVEAPAKE
ncbi:neural cell adhesion molecule homologue isoform X2 [Ciona intestinalis]